MTEPAAPRTGADMAADEIELRTEETVYDGYFRMLRLRLRHPLFAGGASDVVTRELFERGHAVAVLPYDAAADRVVLIEQFRVGAFCAGFHPWLLEIVAGIIEPGETADQVVRRELAEEAGLQARALEPIAHYLCSPGGSSESVQVFCAQVDAAGAGGIYGLDHEHEDIRVLTADIGQVQAWLAARRIDNGSTLIALQWLLLNRERLRAAWRR